MQQEYGAVRNPVVCLQGFYDTDVAASQTDAQLLMGPDGTSDGIVMPKAGYVIGLTASLSAAASAGSMTIGVSIDGTEDSDTTQTVTTGQEVNALFDTGANIRFAAGQQIGVEITTDSSWNATTAELAAQVWVVLEDWDF